MQICTCIYDTRSLENQARPLAGCICLFRCSSPLFLFPTPTRLSSPQATFLISILSFECVLAKCVNIFLILHDIVTNHTLFFTFFPTSQIHPCCWHTSNFDGINLTSFLGVGLSSVFQHLLKTFLTLYHRDILLIFLP